MQWNKLDALGSERLDGQLLVGLCLLHVKQQQITIYTLMIELVELILDIVVKNLIMPNKNLTKEQNTIRNILYGILGLTIFTNFIIFYFALIDQKYSNIISFSMLGIYGIVFYIGHKNQLINKSSSIVAIIIVVIIATIALLSR
jgi:hypothetical protein